MQERELLVSSRGREEEVVRAGEIKTLLVNKYGKLHLVDSASNHRYLVTKVICY